VIERISEVELAPQTVTRERRPMGALCEECGEEPATSILVLDGVSTFMCETCFDWWRNHAPAT
jgi:hypothetical protein